MSRLPPASNRSAMQVSMLSAKPISRTISITSNCLMNKDCFSGVSSRPIYGTTPHSSARISNDCWYAGSRSAATRPLLFSGDCRTRACCPRTSQRNVLTLSAVSTPQPQQCASSRLVMAVRGLTGTSFRTGAALTVEMPKTTTRNCSATTNC